MRNASTNVSLVKHEKLFWYPQLPHTNRSTYWCRDSLSSAQPAAPSYPSTNTIEKGSCSTRTFCFSLFAFRMRLACLLPASIFWRDANSSPSARGLTPLIAPLTTASLYEVKDIPSRAIISVACRALNSSSDSLVRFDDFLVPSRVRRSTAPPSSTQYRAA